MNAMSATERESKIMAHAKERDPLLSVDRLPTFEELSEEFPDELVPPLDRRNVDESKLSTEQKFWRDNGYLILPGFIPEKMVDAYLDLRARNNVQPGGYETALPYMFFDEIKEICCYKPLAGMLKQLVGSDMGMHFNITHLFSTERGWHQDDCLNPPEVLSWYAATWIALEDIHPDCGPFEFVPGSHKWACMKSDKIKQFLKPEFREVYGNRDQGGLHWASLAELVTTKAYEDKLQRSALKTERFLGKKGDLLIWHGRLLHRGSVPNDPQIPRRSIITHYSDVHRRRDLGTRTRQFKDGGWYWDFPHAYLSDAADMPNMERLMREVASLSDERDKLRSELAALKVAPNGGMLGRFKRLLK